MFAEPAPNSARFAFFNPAAHDFYPDWDKVVQEFVAAMRGDAGRNPFDKRLTDLVGELATRSETFRTLWAAHDVRYHRTGVKRIHHPLVGDSNSPMKRSSCPPTRTATLDLHRRTRLTIRKTPSHFSPRGPRPPTHPDNRPEGNLMRERKDPA